MTIVRGQNSSIGDMKEIINLAKKINASVKIIELFSQDREKVVPLYEIKQNLLKLNFKVFEEETHKITMYDGVTKIILSKIFCAAAEDRYNPNSIVIL